MRRTGCHLVHNILCIRGLNGLYIVIGWRIEHAIIQRVGARLFNLNNNSVIHPEAKLCSSGVTILPFTLKKIYKYRKKATSSSCVLKKKHEKTELFRAYSGRKFDIHFTNQGKLATVADSKPEKYHKIGIC